MGDEDEEFESFDVDEHDIDAIMNPGRRRFQTRNDAIYGSFGGGSSGDEDDDDAPGTSSGFRNNKRRKKDFSAPINFISSGIQVGNKPPPQSSSSAKKDDEPIELNPQPSFSSRAGMGGNRANVFAGMRNENSGGKLFDWTKNSKGNVLMNMMKGMGYKEGKGLGAREQGIVEPVMAKPRQGRGAIGAYGKESTSVGPKFGESAAEAQKRIAMENSQGGQYAEEKRKEPLPKGTWKKAGKNKIRYKTIEEVIQEGGSLGQKSTTHSAIKVVDMTKPETRVYNGYESFSMKTKVVEEEIEERNAFDVPELMHNLNLLIDMTEESIRRNDHQLKSLKDQTTALEYDLVQIREVLTKEEKEAQRMNNVYNLIEQFSERKVNTASMNECQQLFITLRADYGEEYRLFNLESVAVACVLPLIKTHFAKWIPLSPDHLIYGVDLMKEWKSILADPSDATMFSNNKRKNFNELPAFDQLLWEGWLPSLRRAALTWEPRDQMEAMLQLIEMWTPVVPVWLKENILEQIIIPRIADRVAAWDPLTDTVPIHSWLVPWFALLGHRLQPVLAPIRQKLAKALRMWNPSDKSAKKILQPWRGVWADATMAIFLAQNVVPKLEKSLDTIDLNPNVRSSYAEFSAVVDWIDMINPDTIANIVTKYFFPRWYETMCLWLDSPGAMIKEVTDWYREWQSRIPPILMEFPTIKENLRRGLIAIGQSRDGMRVSNKPPPPPPMLEEQPPPPPPPMREIPMQSLSLKDVIEMTAAKYGLTYTPQSGRTKDGRQVYWFGTVSIYMDRGMVFVYDPIDFTWRPSAMDELLRMSGAGV